MLFGPQILEITVGAEFIVAQPLLVWYMLAIVISVFGVALQPAMLAMGKAHVSFILLVINTVLYFGSLYIMINSIGLIGVGLAYVFFYMFWFISMISFVFYILKKHKEVQHENCLLF